MSALRKKETGFTIVELLIVIVVIAILAAIIIVAYNGIQERARNTATVSAVNAYSKLIKLYMAGESAYPSTSNTCLRVEAGLCNGSSATMYANLQKYGSLPSGPVYSYITYSYENLAQTVDGQASPVLLLYLLDGANKDCGVANVVNKTAEDTYITDTTAPYNTSPNSAGRTVCWVHIPLTG